MSRPLDHALQVSTASALWTLLASTAAIVIGVRDNSLALIAFGAVGLFDFASDVVLVIHFRAALRETDTEHLERAAIRIVGVGLVAVGVTAAVYSTFHLIDHHAGGSSAASIALAAVSVVALTALAVRKRAIATVLPSAALLADGKLTAVGAVLAAVTLAGTAALKAFDWWWADPVAALAIGIGAAILGAQEYISQRGSHSR